MQMLAPFSMITLKPRLGRGVGGAERDAVAAGRLAVVGHGHHVGDVVDDGDVAVAGAEVESEAVVEAHALAGRQPPGRHRDMDLRVGRPVAVQAQMGLVRIVLGIGGRMSSKYQAAFSGLSFTVTVVALCSALPLVILREK